ncbi:MAG: transglutaminase domain-containing protein [Weeksellaceae bacterium]|nr:transglutaminase domain-containing protein [Weeksellaceae bacterium]
MKKLSYLLLIFACLSAYSQDKLQRVKVEDLKSTSSTLQPSAPAEVLHEAKRQYLTWDDAQKRFYLRTFFERRVKIYDKDKTPNHILNPIITLRNYRASRNDHLQTFSATSYNLSSQDNVQSEKVRNSDIFDDKQAEHVTFRKFTFPNVQNGSIIEYSYEMLQTNFFDTGLWYFQDEIPVVYSYYSFQHFNEFFYNTETKGSADIFTAKNTDFTSGNQIHIHSFFLRNALPITDEPFVLNSDNLRSSVRMELASVNGANFDSHQLAKNWNDVAKTLNSDHNFGQELKGQNYLREKAAEFNNQYSDPNKKLEAVYQFVQQNTNWNSNYGIYTESGIRKTLENKVGNVSDINLLLVSLLRMTGFDANPAVLSSVRNGVLGVQPSLSKLDYVVASVQHNNKNILLDATSKHMKINMLPIRAMNHRAIVIKDNSGTEIPIQNDWESLDRTNLNYKINADGTYEGEFINVQNNYFAINNIQDIENNQQDFVTKFLSRKKVNEYKDVQVNVNPTKDAVRISAKIRGEDNIDVIGNRIFIKPLLFLAQTKNPILDTKRKFPFEFGSPFNSIKIARIQFDEEFEVENVPQNFLYEMDDKVGLYGIEYTVSGNVITVTSQEIILFNTLNSNYNLTLKTQNQHIVDKENTQIILRKK